MTQKTLFTVWSTKVYGDNPEDHQWRSFYDRAAAEESMAKQRANFSEPGYTHYHDPDSWRIVETDVSDLFQLPSRPTPRERYSFRVEETSEPGAWPQGDIVVMRDGEDICSYHRNYQMFKHNFEPFRHKGRDYALISPDYTATSVLDLETGEVIASEEPNSWGFCPVGFYVPDWWDINDGSILPGSRFWDEDSEHPMDGEYAFVWGCVWGDDNGWKVQFLDLSEITRGRITREERFGYQYLDTRGEHQSDFIRVDTEPHPHRVTFVVPKTFDLSTGEYLNFD